MNLVQIRFGNTLSGQIYRARSAQREFQKRLSAQPCDVQIETRSKNHDANLKLPYWPNMMRASLLNLLLFIAVFSLYPEYHPTVHLTKSVIKIPTVDIPETSQQKRPPPPPRPQVPLAVEGDEIPEDVTIESTELDLDKIFIPNLARTAGTDKDEPLDYTEIDYKPHPSRIVTPEYPAEAKKKRIVGKVTVKVLVDKVGNVEDVQFIHGLEIFREAALTAAWQFRFRPGKHQGERRKVWMIMPIEFSLD